MDIFGIGPLELFFILVILLIVMGPNDLAKAGRLTGRTIRRIIQSPTWQMIRNTTRNLRNLPNTLAREAGMEEIQRDLLRGSEGWTKPPGSANPRPGSGSGNYSAWTTPPDSSEQQIGKPESSPEKAAASPENTDE